MPGFNIHLAIAKRHIDKHNILNNEDFYKGNIAPDLVANKDISHYTDPNRKKYYHNLNIYLPMKVMLPKYLKENSIITDYSKGVSLHLITDYLFFNNYLDINLEEYKEKIVKAGINILPWN